MPTIGSPNTIANDNYDDANDHDSDDESYSTSTATPGDSGQCSSNTFVHMSAATSLLSQGVLVCV